MEFYGFFVKWVGNSPFLSTGCNSVTFWGIWRADVENEQSGIISVRLDTRSSRFVHIKCISQALAL